MGQPIEIRGAFYWPGFLARPEQERMVEEIRAVIEAAPLVTPVTPWGKPMSVRMTAAGRLGWVTDRQGYRYEAHHPMGQPWPPVPESVLAVWRAVSGWPGPPDCCLVNWYGSASRMGLHQDRDERDFSAPVLSLSLGDTGIFRLGGASRGGPTARIALESG
ncbi:MAG TPA: alpha-ketoglutarate-dependent dioxygenase AlkB, partial [Paracoccaceae bacterium]|nr:alpha-ketoglutarate-dependent dioxygenase AlkB [Paracoccaceae bacterium]